MTFRGILLLLTCSSGLIMAAPAQQQRRVTTRPHVITGSQIEGTRGYPRIIRLSHQRDSSTAGITNGWLLLGAGKIFYSKDNGASWNYRGELPQQSGLVPLCCATLFEMPRTVGSLREGTLLRGGSYCIGPGAAKPCEGSGGVPGIALFSSKDQGKTWFYLSTPVSAATNTNGGIWEPEFEIAKDNSLVMFWSDETHLCCKGQDLRQMRTTDGVHWQDEKQIVVGVDGARPGMIIVRRNDATGKFFMTYEYCGARQRCSVYFRTSNDGWDFGKPREMGTIIQTADGDILQHAPANIWVPYPGFPEGLLIVSGQIVAGKDADALNGKVLFVNTHGRSGPWSTIPAPIQIPTVNGYQPCVNYSTALLPLQHSASLLELTGAFPSTGPCSIYFASAPLTIKP
jgi:hypothetical protein